FLQIDGLRADPGAVQARPLPIDPRVHVDAERALEDFARALHAGADAALVQRTIEGDALHAARLFEHRQRDALRVEQQAIHVEHDGLRRERCTDRVGQAADRARLFNTYCRMPPLLKYSISLSVLRRLVTMISCDLPSARLIVSTRSCAGLISFMPLGNAMSMTSSPFRPKLLRVSPFLNTSGNTPMPIRFER